MTRAMKDSGIEWIGEIPEDWDLMRLQFCLNEIKEKNLPVKSEQVLSLVKDKGVMPYEEKGNVGNVAKEDISEYKLAYPNTLILNSMNILIGSVGISKYFGCVSPVYYVFKETKMSDLRFINYIFTTNEFQKELRKYANGIMEIRLRVSAQDIFKRIIAYPNKQEQIKIADFLDEKCSHIDSVLEKVRASIDEWKQLKQSVITQAVTKGIKPNRPMKDSGIEWIGEIPANWKVYPLKYLVDIPITDGTHNTPTYTDKENGSPFLSSKDITSGHIDWSSIKYITKELHEQLQKEVAPKRNDILLAKNGTTGIGALVEEDIVFDIYVTLALIRPNQSIVLPKFLLYLINSSLCKIQYDKHLIGIGVPNLHLNIINNVKVIITDAKDEQQEIVSYLDEKCSEIDKLITKKEQLIEELETYKKSLIYEYVTGKKEVK
ncbi:MAG: restriction endonuclease subunit S [Campylobacter sp.]|uniref:restriction endonuclease subunit S n=1 Tax=Campylobacter sp. TaxID=205 RepID=UPI002AA8EEC8|nr:restriction endonuclease subunit S [Campylobacter sp.]MCI6343879.1 restriction endonuclease subunit S [Campylobacter sp.]